MKVKLGTCTTENTSRNWIGNPAPVPKNILKCAWPIGMYPHQPARPQVFQNARPLSPLILNNIFSILQKNLWLHIFIEFAYHYCRGIFMHEASYVSLRRFDRIIRLHLPCFVIFRQAHKIIAHACCPCL